VSERDVVVERPGFAAYAEPVVLAAEAAGLYLGDDLAGRLAPPRDDVDGRAQSVAAEEHRGPADHLDTLHVLEGNEIEIELLHRGLVEPHPVEEHADALGEAGHRRGREAAEREGRLEGRTLLVLQRDAGLALEEIRQDCGPARADLAPLEEVHGARHPLPRHRLRQRPRRRDDHRRERDGRLARIGARGETGHESRREAQ
jgi:hypothetical protein